MSRKLINIVLDLETLSTQENAAILQIGCCVPLFDRQYLTPVCLSEFQATIAYEHCLASDYHKDSGTMEWWEKQSKEAKKIVFSGQDSYADAFYSFKDWIDNIKCGGSDVAIWGNGSDFDNRILCHSLDSIGLHDVWDFRYNRDLRTIRALFPLTEPPLWSNAIHGIKHTALGDARYEADILHKIWSEYYLRDVL
jgi:hypothetical protein